MKKLLYILLIFSCFTINAKQITEQEAMRVASQFMPKQSIQIGQSPVYETLKPVAKQKKAAQGAEYYVFNKGDNAGYIIVSGDDALTEIVGYTNSGNFDEDQMPENMKLWLADYEEYVKAVRSGLAEPMKVRMQSSGSAVAPLITTQWDQVTPYNKLTPVYNGYHTPTGCAATSLAQIMRYYRWPATGIGSNSYYHATFGTLSSNFYEHTYDWDNMIDNYANSYTDSQATAVATLMYDCGIALNMDYALEGSGSNTVCKINGASTHFNYNVVSRSHNSYSTAEFKRIMDNALDNSNPIIFNAQGSGGGHSFVVDGYDATGLYHVNWGWGGVSDGYFNVNYMNPATLGTGGGAGGFNSDQGILIITPNRTGSAPTIDEEIISYSNISTTYKSANRSDEVEFKVTSLFNISHETFNGNIGLGVYDENDNFAGGVKYTVNDLESGYGWNSIDFVLTFTDVANGTYRIYPIYQSNTDSEIQRCYGNKYVNATVSGGTVTFSVPQPTLSLESITKTDDELLLDYSCGFALSMENSAAISTFGTIHMVVKDTAGNTIMTDEIDNCMIYDLSEFATNFQTTFQSGVFATNTEYEIYPEKFVDSDGNEYPITLNCEPLKVKFTGTYSIPDNALTYYNKGDGLHGISLDVNPYDKNESQTLYITYLCNPWGYAWEGYITTVATDIDKNVKSWCDYRYQIGLNAQSGYSKSSFAQLTPNLSSLSDGTYYIHLVTNRLDNGSETDWMFLAYDSYIQINIKDGLVYVDVPAGVNQVIADSAVSVYPNPTTDIVNIKSDSQVKSVKVHSFDGRLVKTAEGVSTINMDDCQNGYYILTIETENETIRTKLLKK